MALSPGVGQRAQIDTETFKALLFINGGGVVSLLALLPQFAGVRSIAYAILAGVILMICGLAFAVLHNYCRRECSLIYDKHGMSPPDVSFLWFKRRQPKVCWWSFGFMVLSILMFVLAGLAVASVGLIYLDELPGLIKQTFISEPYYGSRSATWCHDPALARPPAA